MQGKKENERLNLYISPELLNRLERCALRYGITRTQLALMLIGQGVAGIEKTYDMFENMSKDIVEDLKNQGEK